MAGPRRVCYSECPLYVSVTIFVVHVCVVATVLKASKFLFNVYVFVYYYVVRKFSYNGSRVSVQNK